MRLRTIALVTAALAVSAGTAHAQQASPRSHARTQEAPEQLARQAKITPEQAKAVALKRYPTATVTASELEREHGRLIYSMELKVPGRSGVQEVNVNARTGKLVNIEHESAKAERAEERREASHKPPRP